MKEDPVERQVMVSLDDVPDWETWTEVEAELLQSGESGGAGRGWQGKPGGLYPVRG
jgi:hypothetical protein